MISGAVTDARFDRPTTARVELAALTHNYREAERLAGGRNILAVVKAQAYGHGAVRIARHLVGLGAHTLGVALVEEGRELREAGITAPILVMGALFPGQAEALVRGDLTPAVFTPALADALAQAAQAAGKSVSVHVKIDTGMGRIGIPPEAAAPFIEALTRRNVLRVEGIMTHFADADLRDKQFASRQMDRFDALLADLAGRGISVPLRHAANSAAVLDFSRALFTMVRRG
jgi:alanine racemase